MVLVVSLDSMLNAMWTRREAKDEILYQVPSLATTTSINIALVSGPHQKPEVESVPDFQSRPNPVS